MSAEVAVPGVIVDIALKSYVRGPMRRLKRVLLHRDFGLDGKITQKGYRQVTLVAEEAWADVLAEIRDPLPWYERRSNLLTRDVDLAGLIGRTAVVGSAIILVLGELEPCARMREIHPLLFDALQKNCRGGVFGRIEQNGVVRVGDPLYAVA